MKAIRLRRELTHEALGEQAGINYTYLGVIERGERNPSMKQLLKLAQALGLDPYELLIVNQEELSLPQLRAMIQALLEKVSRAELQLAYKLLNGLLR